MAEILAVNVADTESEATYQECFRQLKARGLQGVELVTSDDYRRLVAAVKRHFQGASWQRCHVHVARGLLGVVGATKRAALGAEQSDEWVTGKRSLDISELRQWQRDRASQEVALTAV